VSGEPRFYKVFARQCDALLQAAMSMQDLKVFAFEVDNSGKRQFVTCHPQRLWTFYKELPKRHYYEVIPQDKPCKLFFDLEFSKVLNPEADGPAMTKRFISELGQSLAATFGLCGPTIGQLSMVELDSTTEAKFSRHLIINSHVFENIHQMRLYVKDFCGKLRELDNFPKIITTDGTALFVDEGVYTKNRNFRLYLSSKFGKDAILKQVASSTANQKNIGSALQSHSDDQKVFLDSLVTEVNNSVHLLQFTEDYLIGPSSHQSSINHSSSNQSSINQTAFPEIDDFVLSLVNELETGRTGYIRKCSTNGPFLNYDIAGSFKYCHNVERHHKSNNIRWVVDIEKGHYFQMCYDQNCKDFRSNSFQLPKSCQPWLEMFD